jgi:dTDP-4-amino-4,6-dideoxygalactose transaminase
VSLEDRLAAHFGLSAGTVVTVANATLGLTLALLAQNVPPGAFCIMPAWTFVASVHAARMANLIPYFVDVDAETWALDAASVAEMIAGAGGSIGAVMPVAPFGRPIDTTAWDNLRSRTGVSVVIDAAAGFDSTTPGKVPAVVSLHATKVLGVGEGGFVISADSSIIDDIRARSNFGFAGTREAAKPAANAKLSEYHAAVGLAALDEWAEVRNEWFATAQSYRNQLPESNCLQFQVGFGHSWVSSTCVLGLVGVDAARTATILDGAEIETRQWWGLGAHEHPATTAFPRGPLSTTETLIRTTLAIPFSRDIGAGEIRRVAEALSVAIKLSF